MNTFIDNLKYNSRSVRDALACESGDRPTLNRSGSNAILQVIYCLLWREINRPASIYKHLRERGCTYDRTAIEALLSAYEGDDPDRHLWSRDSYGRYEPNL